MSKLCYIFIPLYFQVLQNFHMIGAWCLLRGLHALLHMNPAGFFEKSKDTAAVSTTAKTKTPSDVSTSSIPAGKSRDPTTLVSKFAYGKM